LTVQIAPGHPGPGQILIEKPAIRSDLSPGRILARRPGLLHHASITLEWFDRVGSDAEIRGLERDDGIRPSKLDG
jgi:hypothetical protein